MGSFLYRWIFANVFSNDWSWHCGEDRIFWVVPPGSNLCRAIYFGIFRQLPEFPNGSHGIVGWTTGSWSAMYGFESQLLLVFFIDTILSIIFSTIKLIIFFAVFQLVFFWNKKPNLEDNLFFHCSLFSRSQGLFYFFQLCSLPYYSEACIPLYASPKVRTRQMGSARKLRKHQKGPLTKFMVLWDKNFLVITSHGVPKLSRRTDDQRSLWLVLTLI